MFSTDSEINRFFLSDYRQPSFGKRIDMSRVATIVLGGGQGTRLFPLTMNCCKPAICFGGRYRLIDVPISNAIHSGSQMIFIITQFLSSTLHRYISQTYNLGSLSAGFIDVLSTEERHAKQVWFQGTADAVRQNLHHFKETPAEYFLILSGDQLYNMDFSRMLQFALDTDSDAVVAALPVAEKDASRMGILQIDERFFINDFREKPKEKSILDALYTPQTQLKNLGIPTGLNRNYLASMGIYLFKREALFSLLENDGRHDFGKDLIPSMVENGNVSAYLHNGYWEDIGTITSFYEANVALTKKDAPFSCYNEANPIFTTRYNLPGLKISRAQIVDSIICEGSILEDCRISGSIVGPRTVIREGTEVIDSYVMGNEYYEAPVQNWSRNKSALEIGKNCTIVKAILDKNAALGDNVKLMNQKGLQEYDSDGVYIRDGIIVVSRGARIPDGYVL